MRRSRGRLAAAIAVAACAGAIVAATVSVEADLGFFLPKSDTPADRVIADLIREGPASGLILMAIGGGERNERLAASDALVRNLAHSGQFVFVSNGTPAGIGADLDALARYRFVLNPPPPPDAFSAEELHASLEDAAAALGTAFGGAVKGLLPRDPTLRTLDIARFWASGGMAPRRAAPWESPDGELALAVALPHAKAYDFAARERVLSTIRAAFDAQTKADGLALRIGGPSVIALETRDRIRSEAQWLTVVSTVLVGGFVLWVFASAGFLACLILPVAAGMLCGTAAVQILFGEVHGVTLAFGSILIGVATDYAVHLFVHAAGSKRLADAAAEIAPTLAMSVGTTIVAFLPMALSSLPGLSQLGIFASVGLAAAAVVTFWAVPAVLADPGPVRGRAALSFIRYMDRMPRLGTRAVTGALAVAAAGYLFSQAGDLWSHDLRELSPVPRASTDFDQRIRTALDAPDVRRLIVVSAPSADRILEIEEALMPRLDDLVRAGKLEAFEMAARYLPSLQRQRETKARLPDSATLRRAFGTALAGLPFRPDAFEPFFADVERARTEAPVSLEQFLGGPFGWRLAPLVHRRDDGWTGLVLLAGVADPAAVARVATGFGDGAARYFDLKDESERLMVRYRNEALRWIAVGAAGALVLLAVGLRRIGTVLRVVTPIFVTIVLTIAILVALERSLTIMHVTALLLVAGLGLDYALFLNREAESADDARRTALGVVVSTITTVIVFAVLAFSALPVLNSIGEAVAIGAALSMTTAFLFRRKPRGA